MSNALIILLGGIGASVSWGISDYFSAHSAKKIGPMLASAAVNAGGALLFIAIYFIFYKNHTIGDVSGVILSVAAGITLALGDMAFFKGLKKGPVSIVSPLSSLYPLVTTVMAIVAFSAIISSLQVIGILLIVAGVLAASGLLNTKKSERKIASGPRYALLAALFWGIGYSLLAQGIIKLGWQTATMIEFVFVAVTFIILTPRLKGREVVNAATVKKAFRNKFVIGAIIIQMIGELAFNYALSKEASSGAIVTALSATYPLLTVLLVIKNMKEKVSLLPLVGVFIGVTGVIIITLG